MVYFNKYNFYVIVGEGKDEREYNMGECDSIWKAIEKFEKTHPEEDIKKWGVNVKIRKVK